MDAIRYIRISLMIIANIIFVLIPSIAQAENQFINFNHNSSIDIGQSGWKYIISEQSTVQNHRNIHPSLKNISDFIRRDENIVDDYSLYQKVLKLHPDLVGQRLALYIPYQNSINKISINEQTYVHVNQSREFDPRKEVRVAPRLIVFTPSQSIVNIKIEVIDGLTAKKTENISYDLGQVIDISPVSVAIRKENIDVFIRTLFIGAILIIGVFTTVFAYSRNREQYYYFFGLFTIFTALRALFSAPYLYATISDFDWLWSTRFEFILGEIMTIVFLAYIKHLFQQYFSSVILYTSFILMVFLIFITLLFDPQIFQRLFFFVFILIFLTSFYFIYLFLKSIRNNKIHYQTGHLASLVILTFAFFHDFLYYFQIIKTTDLVLFFISAYVLFVTIEMSVHYSTQVARVAKLYREFKVLNNELDEKVNLRTLELKVLNDKLDKQSKIDVLTGIYNRGSLNFELEEKFLQCQMQNKSLTILMIDIDFFKLFNDFYGHLKGDILIKTVVQIIKQNLPEESFLARYGGEEFAVIMQDQTPEFAEHIAQQICDKVAAQNIEHLGRSSPRYVTISIGGITVEKLQSYQSVSDILHLADVQLYASKMNGRNQVSFH